MAQYEQQLRQLLSKYPYADAAKRDCISLLSGYSDLRPSMENFIFNNGESKQLAALTGTIPVSHRGNTYNIPVSLYMLEKHPYDPPLVYVKPTANMEVRPSQHVDTAGKIYLPYLSSWRHPSSDLSGLVQLLQFQFGESPPVVSRVNKPAQQQPAYQPPGVPNNQQFGWGSGYGWNAPANQQSTPAVTRPDFNEETMRLSIMSALEDKVRRKYREKRAQLQAEYEVIQRTGEELKAGKTKLEEMESSLDQEIASLEVHLATLREKNAELDAGLAQMQQQEQVSVDDAVEASAPLYRQIVNAYAEEQALDDAVYNLGEALRKGALELDVYLKSVRELSRRQFYLRATIQQGRLKAGLPEL